jgi:hypothetical protein
MDSQKIPWAVMDTGDNSANGSQDPRESLLRVSRGQAGLPEAFQTLNQYEDNQAREAADLLERETWAVTGIIEASGVVWHHLSSSTVRFVVDAFEHADHSHVELGWYTHLSGLDAPSADEQSLMQCATPCFARVYASHDRQAAGYTGALACSYVPMPVAEAVTAIGAAKVLDEIDAATRVAGHALLSVAEDQSARYQELLRVERMLGWVPDPAASPDGAPTLGTRVALALVGHGEHRWLMPVAASMASLAVLSWFVPAVLYMVLAVIVLGLGVVLWRVMSTPGP